MAYPNSNLPSPSQPWGREIQKNLETVQAQFLSERTNNTARDAQLQASYKRLDATVVEVSTVANQAQDAIDAVTGLGVPGSGTIVNASNIIGGTLKTATSGRHTEITATQVQFFDGDGNYSGKISAADDGRASTVEIETTSGSGFIAYNGGSDLYGPGSTISAGNNGNGNISLNSSGGVSVSGVLSADSTATISGSIYGYSNALITGQVSGGTLYTGGSLSAGSISAGSTSVGSLTASGVVNATDTYSRNVQSGRIMYVASNGTYNCATSSARYKQDINPYVVDVNKFFQLEPVSFRYKMAVEQFGEQADIAHGFIAEQAAEVGMDEFVDFQDDGNGGQRPDNFRYIDFTAAMYAVIKSQQSTIESLTARIEALESKV